MVSGVSMNQMTIGAIMPYLAAQVYAKLKERLAYKVPAQSTIKWHP